MLGCAELRCGVNHPVHVGHFASRVAPEGLRGNSPLNCHEAPRASVYHGLAYFGDFRLQNNCYYYYGIGMMIIMGSVW